MIRITLDLPATAADMLTYAELVADIGPEIDIATEDGCLVGLLVGQAPTVAEPEPEPAPAPKTTKAPKAKAKAETERKTAPAARKVGSGTVAVAILQHLHDEDLHEGSYAALARAAYPTNPPTAQAGLSKMENLGWIHADRTNGRVKRVWITDAGEGALSRMTDTPAPDPQSGRRLNPVPETSEQIAKTVPTAPAPRRDDREAFLPASGLTTPAGG